MTARLPSCLTRAELAAELMVSESTIDMLVRTGVLPKPIRLGGCVRWRWETVNLALASLETGANHSAPANDEAAGVQRAIEKAKERGRGRAA